MNQKLAIGIDFGTTYSCSGVWINGGVVIIPNGIGERTTPSVVIFEKKNEYYVGEETLNHFPKKNSVKIFEIKRLIGKNYNEILDLLDYFPFKIEKEENGEGPVIVMTFDNEEKVKYTPEQIVCLIFKKIISNAESFLNQKVTDVVITVPADFNHTQRHAIKKAAESIRGIKVLKLINEPSAAALTSCFYQINKNDNIMMIDIKNIESVLLDPAPNLVLETPFNNFLNTNTIIENNDSSEKFFLVFDLGGGTYDVSLVEQNDTMVETISSSGNQMLGGGDFDKILIDYCLSKLDNLNLDQKIIKEDFKSMQRLKMACEQTKKFLSIKELDTIYIEDFYKEESLSIPITRENFEKLCKELFDKLIGPIDNVLKDSKIDINQIQEVILVGGSSKIPKIKNILSEKFPNTKINDTINPDEVVAYGATLFCEKLVRNDNETLKDFEYFDCTQHSYGIETENGDIEIILPRGSKYPSCVTKYFHNTYNDQITFDINVYEGEQKKCRNNKLLAKFTIEGIPKKKKGELILTVNIGIDTNQTIYVNAYVAENNIKKGIKIKNDNRFENMEVINIDDAENVINYNDINKKRVKYKNNIIDYYKSFKNTENVQEKYAIIKNYHIVIIDYLKFLEEKCFDIESEEYLSLVDKLFKSYRNIYITDIFKLFSSIDKENIETNIKLYLKKICLKNPFRLKPLLNNFENIKREISEIFYSISVYCMKILREKALNFFNLKKKNSSSISKNIYEECLNIAKSNFNEKILNLISNELKNAYEDIKEECEVNIKIISAEFFNGIDNTKKTGKLFSDDDLDYDNLCLLSFNFSQALKQIDTIKNLDENKEALETKSICLANIVKIEYTMKKRRITLENLKLKADISIEIVDKKLSKDKEYVKKNWYNEVVELRNDIQKKIDSMQIIDNNNNNSNLDAIFNEKFLCGDIEFLTFLLTNYPYKGFNGNMNFIEEYKKNKKKFLKKLIINYKKYDNASNNETSNNETPNNDDDLSQKKEIILKYINNTLNQLNNVTVGE